MTGALAISKAGHDRDRIYVIVGEEGDFVYLADGRIRSLHAPKKKNKKHMQIIKKLPPDVAAVLADRAGWSDLTLKRAIKLYRIQKQPVGTQEPSERKEDNECQKQM